jgi:hypothetical protein
MLTRAFILAVLAGITGMLCIFSPEIRGGGKAGVIMQLPTRLAGYASEAEAPEPIEKKLLPADTEFAKANYFTPTSDSSKRDVAHCTIVLSGAERKSIHRPEVCLQGQGWTLVDSRTLSVDIGNGRTLAVKDLDIKKIITLNDGTKKPLRAHYIYWFVGADVTTPSHAERIWLTLWDNITRNINHRWAYPSMMALVTENFTPEEIGQRPRTNEQTVEMLLNFIKELAPKFQKSLM